MKMVRIHKEALLFTSLCFLAAISVLVGYYIFFRTHSTSIQEPRNSTKLGNAPFGQWGTTCPGLAYIEDNVCDDEYNTALCEFDGGDCCKITSDFSSCTACKCNAYPVYKSCSDYWSHCKIFHIGDGYCDDYLNIPECYFDAGDCCITDEDSLLGASLLCEICVCIASDLFCRQEELGNGICEDWNNSLLCGFDDGDCCDKVGKDIGYNNTCCDCYCFGQHTNYKT